MRCLHPAPDPALVQESVREGIDWVNFANLCRLHAVRPLINRTIQSFPDPERRTFPDKLSSVLSQFTTRNALRNTILSLELIRLLRLLEGRGIRAATFKGPILAHHIYRDIGLREFLDVDIVVPEHDFPAAQKILVAEGYVAPQDSEQQSGYFGELGQMSFRRPRDGICVDLHWKLTSFGATAPFSEEEMWHQAQILPLLDSHVLTFASEHLALFLTFHGSKERWGCLKWVCDFAEFVQRNTEFDWIRLLQSAEQRRCSRDLLVAAQLVRTLGLASPAALLAKARKSPSAQNAVARTLNSLFRPVPEDDLSLYIQAFRSRERTADKLAVTVKLLTTITVSDLATVRLPPRLNWLYYVIRPFRLAFKTTHSLLRRAARRHS
jgi:hypothetical protein